MNARQRAAIARTEGRLARSAAGRHLLGGAPGSTGPRQTGATAPATFLPPADDRDEARVDRGGPEPRYPFGSHCSVCGAAIFPSHTGRPRTTCSDACRKAAWRACHETPAGQVHRAGPSRPATVGRPARPATLAAIAEGITTPIDEHGPARAYVAARPDGYGVVFGMDGGRLDHPAGPAFPRPRPALELAALLNDRITPAPPAA